VQARLLPVILSVASLSMALVQLQSGGWQSFAVPSSTGTVTGSAQLCCLCFYPSVTGSQSLLPTQSQASYRSASSSPSARRPSSGFDVGNEEADTRENVVGIDGHADVRASAAMTDDNDDDADDSNFDDTLSEILCFIHSGTRLLLTLILLLAPSTPTSTSLALTCSLPLPFSLLPSPLLLLLLLLGSPSEIKGFSLHNHLFPILVAILS